MRSPQEIMAGVQSTKQLSFLAFMCGDEKSADVICMSSLRPLFKMSGKDHLLTRAVTGWWYSTNSEVQWCYIQNVRMTRHTYSNIMDSFMVVLLLEFIACSLATVKALMRVCVIIWPRLYIIGHKLFLLLLLDVTSF